MKRAKNTVNRSQAIIDSIVDDLLVIDRDYHIIEANEAVAKKHRTSVIGKHCYEISHGLSRPCRLPHHECPLKEVWETGQPARVTHLHTHRSDGKRQKKYVDIIASPIKDDQENVVAVTELMRDVTASKETELKILEAQRNLLALNTIATAVSQSLDPETVLYRAIEKTLEIMDRNTGGILLWDDESKKLCYRVHNGLSKEFAQTVCFLPGEGIVGRAAETGQVILVDDVSKDPRVANLALVQAERLRAFAAVPLRVKDRVLGVLTVASHDARKFSAEDVQLLEGIASQIAIAVENARLHQEVQRKDESRGELLVEVLSIQEEERRRIARELHDETSQALASLAASLEAVTVTLPASAARARDRIKIVEQVALHALDEIHRIIYELRPTLLDDLGLVAATRWLLDKNLAAAGVAVKFKTEGKERRLPSRLETTLFRVIQEAVSNIARHAAAKNADVALYFKKKAIAIRVRDDGKGFDVDEAIRSRERPRGLGLLGMKERIEILKGALRISSRPGAGTEIDINIPTDGEVSGG